MNIDFKVTGEDLIVGRVDNILNTKMQIIIEILIVYILPIIYSKFLYDIIGSNKFYIVLILYIFFVLINKYLLKDMRSRKLAKAIYKSEDYSKTKHKLSLEVTCIGITILQNKINLSLPWNIITNVLENKNFFHIYNEKNIKVFIPKKYFNNSQELTDFRNELEKHVNVKLSKRNLNL